MAVVDEKRSSCAAVDHWLTCGIDHSVSEILPNERQRTVQPVGIVLGGSPMLPAVASILPKATLLHFCCSCWAAVSRVRRTSDSIQPYPVVVITSTIFRGISQAASLSPSQSLPKVADGYVLSA